MNQYILRDFNGYFVDDLTDLVSDDQISSMADSLINEICSIPRKYLLLNVLQHDIACLIWKIFRGIKKYCHQDSQCSQGPVGAHPAKTTYPAFWDNIMDYYEVGGQFHELDNLISELYNLVRLGYNEYINTYDDFDSIRNKIIRKFYTPIQSNFISTKLKIQENYHNHILENL